MKVFVVIAAYNEERSILTVIDDLIRHNYNYIVVVDDGSMDRTFEVISKKKVFALKHVINRGQGAALKTGIDFALLQGADYIVTFDADGQHHADEIKDLLKPVVSKKFDVALGSRFLKSGTNLPLFRRFVLKAGVIVVWLFYGVKMTDSHNGFRILSRKAAEKISITSDRMEHSSQIIEEIRKHNIKYKEVPVTITYTDYSLSKGQSSLDSVKIGFKMIFRKFLK